MANNGSARSGSGGRAVANRGGRASAASRKRSAEPNGKGSAGVAETVAAPTSLRGRSESKEQLIDFYRQMVLIRRFEEKTGEMYTRAKIGGYCHLNLGEEATIVGVMSALEPRDYMFTNYREHGYILARGVDPNRIMAELFGKETGVSQGPGRLDAPVRRRGPLHGRLRDRRRPAAAGDRRRAGHRLPRRRTRWWSARWATPPPTSAPSTSR